MKRLCDVVVAGLVLILVIPLLIAAGLLIRLKLGHPVLFVQERAGQWGRPFGIIKLRTMRHAVGPDGALLPDAERLTAFGALLRSTSIDELPELINVIRGEMSLVGPRPLPTSYLPLYTPLQQRRHAVLPGITGWAQVNGRNALTWEERFALDLWYIDNRSFWVDLQVLGLTVWKVLARQGVSQDDHVTMSPFTGTKS